MVSVSECESGSHGVESNQSHVGFFDSDRTSSALGVLWAQRGGWGHIAELHPLHGCVFEGVTQIVPTKLHALQFLGLANTEVKYDSKRPVRDSNAEACFYNTDIMLNSSIRLSVKIPAACVIQNRAIVVTSVSTLLLLSLPRTPLNKAFGSRRVYAGELMGGRCGGEWDLDRVLDS